MRRETDRREDAASKPASEAKGELLQTCPMCSKAYPTEQIRVVEQISASRLLHLSCPDCSNAMLAVVVQTEVGTSSIGMVTDLSMQDVLRIQTQHPLALDDALDWHEVLSGPSEALLEHLNTT